MNLCTASMQVTVGAVLTHMGHAGFEQHIQGLQEQYARRAAIIMSAMDRHLTGLADWAPVEAGMFLWVKLRGFEDASQILGSWSRRKSLWCQVIPLSSLLAEVRSDLWGDFRRGGCFWILKCFRLCGSIHVQIRRIQR